MTDIKLDSREYSDFVNSRTKNPEDILCSLSPGRVNILHATLGISGEAGELVDAIKKYIVYNRELDIENIKEELGDLFFYIQMLMNSTNLTMEQIIKHNMEKLNKRYATTYTDKEAIERNDKTPKPLFAPKIKTTDITFECPNCLQWFPKSAVYNKYENGKIIDTNCQGCHSEIYGE